MSRKEAFTPEQLAAWHDGMLAVPGVQRVGLEDSCFLNLVPALDDTNDPTGYYRRHYAESPYSLFVGAVADESAREGLVDYCSRNIPGQKQAGVAIVKPERWEFATSMVSARDIIDYFIRSKHLLAPAAEGHASWRQGKNAALQDPNNPYRGYGPERLKVGNLTAAQRRELEIADNADLAADVYHPLDVPFMQLSPDMHNKNIVPMAAACLAVADFLMDDAATIEDMDTVMKTIADGADPIRQRTLNMVAHVAWTASDLSFGGRPWATAQENYHPYSSLSPDVQDLDTQAMHTPITYMRHTIAETYTALNTMDAALKRDGGPYERWWVPEYTVLTSVEPFRSVAIHDEDQGNVWGLTRRASQEYENNTNRPAAAFHSIMPKIIDKALSKGFVAHDSDGFWHLTVAGRARLDDLSEVQVASLWGSLEDYVKSYDTLKSRYAA